MNSVLSLSILSTDSTALPFPFGRKSLLISQSGSHSFVAPPHLSPTPTTFSTLLIMGLANSLRATKAKYKQMMSNSASSLKTKSTKLKHLVKSTGLRKRKADRNLLHKGRPQAGTDNDATKDAATPPVIHHQASGISTESSARQPVEAATLPPTTNGEQLKSVARSPSTVVILHTTRPPTNTLPRLIDAPTGTSSDDYFCFEVVKSPNTAYSSHFATTCRPSSGRLCYR